MPWESVRNQLKSFCSPKVVERWSERLRIELSRAKIALFLASSMMAGCAMPARTCSKPLSSAMRFASSVISAAFVQISIQALRDDPSRKDVTFESAMRYQCVAFVPVVSRSCTIIQAIPSKRRLGPTIPKVISGRRARDRSRQHQRVGTAWAFGNRFCGSICRQRSTISANRRSIPDFDRRPSGLGLVRIRWR